jgi:hypothetical protein
MTDREGKTPPVDESTYAASAAESGGLYDDSGPTMANREGDTMAVDDFEDNDGPGADPGSAYQRAVAEGQVQPEDEDAPSVTPDEVFRSGS